MHASDNFDFSDTEALSPGMWASYEPRPQDYKQNLWNVNHANFHKPGERFINKGSVYTESISNCGRGPLEGAPLPRGMMKFVEHLVSKFRVVPTKFTSVSDVAWRVLTFLDYTEPYYLFYNSCVQLVPNQLKYTYRHKHSGSVLPPDSIEVFEIMPGWKFQPFKTAWDLLNHPTTDMVIRGEFIKHSKRGDAVTTTDITNKLSALVWGDPEFIESWINEWLMHHYQDVEFDATLPDDEVQSLESFMDKDAEFWRIVALACLLWFRSEHALPFLIEFHPIYGSILGWAKDAKIPHSYIEPESGGEAIVYKWDVYTHKHLIVEKNAPPGSCDSCHQALHCTKVINAQAINHPICSCDKEIDIMDVNFQKHGYGLNSTCSPYREQHPPIAAFGCQRCLGMLLKNRTPDMACEHSPLCPNTGCQWHGGAGLYLRNLTERRKMLLTHNRPQ